MFHQLQCYLAYLLLLASCWPIQMSAVWAPIWSEPVLVWLAIAMPTGSGKSSLYTFLLKVIQDLRSKCNRKEIHPSWTLEEASFEKMGVIMAENDGRFTWTL